jgi:hypothetical protein
MASPGLVLLLGRAMAPRLLLRELESLRRITFRPSTGDARKSWSMGIRQLYLLAGILWALLLAPIVVLVSIGAGAGIAWIFLFGDNPWPHSVGVFLIAIAAVTSLSVAIASISIGNATGKAQAASATGTSPAMVRHARTLCIAPVIIAVVAGSALWLRDRANETAVTENAARDADFVDLVKQTKKILALEIVSDSQGEVRAAARISGLREADYELKWTVLPSSSELAIVQGERVIRLLDGDEEFPLSFPIDLLKSQYRTIVLRGRGGALVDEQFRLEVALRPIFSTAERRRLPPGEERRLNTRDSPLESRRSVDFGVRFTIQP